MLRVFVVEDSALLRQELIKTVPWAQLQCVLVGEAADGREAEQLIRASQPDIVITDICMPLMDGLELIEALQDLEDIHFIIISAYSKFEYAMKAIKLRVSDYIIKPINDQELYETISKVVRQRQQSPQRPDATIQPSAGGSVVASPAGSASQAHMHELMRYMHGHFAQDITIADVAKALFISESYVSKLFRRELDTSFVEYMSFLRIQRAAELLRSRAKPQVLHVSDAVGYKDYRYFCASFKKLMGVTPKQYQLNSLDKGE